MSVPDITKVRQFDERIKDLEQRLHNGGGPPYDGSMDARLSKLEALVPTLATREDIANLRGAAREDIASLRGATTTDLANLRAEMHKGFSDLRSELHSQTWRLIGVLAVTVGATVAIGQWLKL